MRQEQDNELALKRVDFAGLGKDKGEVVRAWWAEKEEYGRVDVYLGLRLAVEDEGAGVLQRTRDSWVEV
jgi:hypothetical protein